MEVRGVVQSGCRGASAVLDGLLIRVGGERSEIWVKFSYAVVFRMIMRVVGSWRWVTVEVNFLMKRLAIDCCSVRDLVPILMG